MRKSKNKICFPIKNSFVENSSVITFKPFEKYTPFETEGILGLEIFENVEISELYRSLGNGT